MSNVFTTLVLGQGQLASTIGDIYTSPALTTTVVKTITVVNTDSVTRTVNLYILKAAGSARKITPMNMPLLTGESLVFDSVFTLAAGDKIQGDASAATCCDFIISGVQET